MNALVGTGLSAVLLLTTLAVASEAQTSGSTAAPRIIFVCEHGAAKSVIAAAYFNKTRRSVGSRPGDLSRRESASRTLCVGAQRPERGWIDIAFGKAGPDHIR